MVLMITQTLLTAGNAKIVKGEKLGYVTKGIHLAQICRATRFATGEAKVAQWLA